MVYEPTEEDRANPCVVCSAIYDGENDMIQCDTCDKWYHKLCVGNPNVGENDSWDCKECVEQKGRQAKSIDARMKQMEKIINKQNQQLKELQAINERLLKEKNNNSDASKPQLRRSNMKTKTQASTQKASTSKTLNCDALDSSEDDNTLDVDQVNTSKTFRQMKRYIVQQELRHLPSFDGTAMQWPAFYRSYTDSKEHFSSAANRNRLQHALTGKALKAVSGLLLTPDTVDDAMDMLAFRFGQSEHVIQNSIDQAMSAEQPNEGRPESIADYAMLILTISANISAVGDESDKMNPMLIKMLVERLPDGLRRKWCRYRREWKDSGRVVKIGTFSKWLLDESQDYVDMIPASTSRENKGKSNKHKSSINVHQCSIIEKDAEQSRKKKKRICFKCSSEEHQLSQCEEFLRMTCDDRKKFAGKNQLCFVCLKRGHRWQRCFHKDSDGSRSFHKLLEDTNSKNSSDSIDLKDEVEPTMSHFNGDANTLFKIVPVVLHGPVSQISTYALLDECASVTLLEEETANKLQLTGPIVPLWMGWTKNITNLEKDSIRVKLGISAPGVNSSKYHLKNVSTVKQLALPSQDLDAKEIQIRYPYLRAIDIESLKSAVPTILIGLDNSNLIAPLESKTDPGEIGPVAVRTKLGWSIHGPESHCSGQTEKHSTLLICECKIMEEEKLEEMLQRYFSMEDFGVKPVLQNIQSSIEKRAYDILKNTTKREGDCYVTGLLWKTDVSKMPNNFNMCLRRLVSIENKMIQNLEFGDVYRLKIQDYIAKGYAVKLSEGEVAAISDNMWYLPHFGISTPSKPKLRLVFDAKAKFSGVSLNSELLTGPDHYSSLVGLLMKIREGKFAVAADIREMFHMIKIREADRKFQCFLWRSDKSKKPETYMMTVMIFGAKCSPCSAQYVRKRNALEYENGNSRAVHAIQERFYVDDYMDSFESEQEALEVTKSVIEICKHGNFDLRNVISNSSMIMSNFYDKTCQSAVISMNVDNEDFTEKILGLFWDTRADELMFRLRFVKLYEEAMQSSKMPTKRETLRTMMSVFDPIGYLAHYMVRAKIILQDIWMRKISDWDTPLPEDLGKRWFVWLKELKKVENLRIPRNYWDTFLSAKNIELHIFTDASDRAYAAVAFFRFKINAGNYLVRFVASKTKIASQKSNKILSMPRLELQGAPYVAHRIAEVLESSLPSQWNYVSSKENPADHATKATKILAFDINNQWFQGPVFLKYDEKEWPVRKKQTSVQNDDPEIKRIFLINANRKCERDYSPIEPNDYSDWHEMLRVTAWIKRGLYNFNNHIRKKSINTNPLSWKEIEEASKYHIKKSQIQSYPEEMSALMNNKPVSNKSKIIDLIPFLDEEGLLRMHGRIESPPNASYDMKAPVILNRKHRVTHLIIDECHKKFHHQFQESVVNDLRTKFWIPQLRIAVKECRKRCQTCKNRDAVAIPPQMAKLPIARVESQFGCFYHCGIDLFGPLMILNKRSLEKRWGVIFTCLVSRAIYLDVVPNLTADALIMSIGNCNARRGRIKNLYCDCGTNLKGAQRELKEALSQISDHRLQSECLKQGIQWHFNPPASPHMGGCWERMIRSVKAVLSSILKERHPKDNTLRSLFCEIESIINSRPLTYIALEKDTDDALTPNHLMNPFFRFPTLPLGEFDESDLITRKQWRWVQEMANHFWRRWLAEYLPMLNRTTKWHEKTMPLKEGDVVVICDKSAPRNLWEKAIVVSVRKSKDDQVRSATVKTSHGLLTRPAVIPAKLDVTAVVNSPEFTEGNVEEVS